ncbi:MAG: lipoyl(octanoyl) transferase LipB [Candidatus Omnitrophica bacterium]|nr:lipoyl(octanoyl) transferase LipB [Candidatus Omnitrophota bacterium]
MEIFDLGLVSFEHAWQFQREIHAKIKEGNSSCALVLCRHYPVITMGRNAKKVNILVSEENLKNRGIAVYQIERGGDVTYHGPGQLCVYPVMNLRYLEKSVHSFLDTLENIGLDLLSKFGIKATTMQKTRGIWVGQEKIASLGIAVRNWITFHGMSINIKKDDLLNFSLIVPCGLNIMMTSMESILEKEIEIGKVKEVFIEEWRQRVNI